MAATNRPVAQSANSTNAAKCPDCRALAREALECARAFRQSVAEFDKIDVDAIFGELKKMRSSLDA